MQDLQGNCPQNTGNTLKTIISPSILACDFATLAEECEKVLKFGADWLHIDVMDGHFVENLSLGPPVLLSLSKKVPAFYDCHLMVANPWKWVKEFAKSGANSLTFHYESNVGDIEELIEEIKRNGMKVGIALKPGTEIDQSIEKILEKGRVDLVLVMTVEPGFGGQKFMPEVLEKLSFLRKRFPSLGLQVDGGIKCENIEQVAEKGANIIVSGTGIFNHSSPGDAISTMRSVVSRYL